VNAGPLRVLIADDDPVASAFLVAALSDWGATCEVVHDGCEALARATRQHFDLLLLDLRMPSRTGPDVLRALRDDPGAASHGASACALSADLDHARRRALLDAGFADALQKPVTIDVLETIATAAAAALGRDPLRAAKPSATGPAFDDQAALSACGSAEVLAGLRALLRAELAARVSELQRALDTGAIGQALEIVHRMRGACRFAGAVELDAALLALASQLRGGHPPARCLEAVDAAARRVLERGDSA
jgi:two-component system sensor histidine kinase BarA